MRGIDRRLEAGRDPLVASVASVCVSRWDKAIAGTAPDALRNGLCIAVGMQCYRAYRDLLDSKRWTALEPAGARPQRLLWASTRTKAPSEPDTSYVEDLYGPGPLNPQPPKPPQTSPTPPPPTGPP